MLIILLSGDIDEDEPNIQQAVLGTAGAGAAGILGTVEEALGTADDDTALQHILVAGLGHRHLHAAHLPQVGLVLEVQEEME